MNKALLIWNILLTITLAMLVISGCASMDPQFASISRQVKENRALIEQVVSLANSNSEAIKSNTISITKNTLIIANLQKSTQAAIAATDASLRQLIQTYVAAQQ